jgi:hypothetical protein
MQRGRKSAAALLLNVNHETPRLTAPAGLTAKERALFSRIVNASEARHFRENESELLVSYVQAVLMVREAVRKHEMNDWEKASRIQLSLAMRLRLAPSSRLDPRTVNRFEVNDQRPPWESKED